MEGQNLGVRVSVDSQYYKDFLEIIKKERLAISELYDYQRKDEAPIIGRVMDSYIGFKKALVLEKFLGLENERVHKEDKKYASRLWINTGSVEDDFKITIGKKGKDFIVSKRPIKEKVVTYFLFDLPYKNGSKRLTHKNNYVDIIGRKVDWKDRLVDNDGNVLVDVDENFIGDYNDIVWLKDIPELWTGIPYGFLQETYELLGIQSSHVK